MLKLHYKSSVLIVWVAILAGLGSLSYFIWIREPEINIYRAEYLEKIGGDNSPVVFIVKTSPFYQAKCNDIELWARKNTLPFSVGGTYEFLKYNEKITHKNAFIEHDFSSIARDYWLCVMDIDKYCFICKE